jgi:hypothetical protein
MARRLPRHPNHAEMQSTMRLEPTLASVRIRPGLVRASEQERRAGSFTVSVKSIEARRCRWT